MTIEEQEELYLKEQEKVQYLKKLYHSIPLFAKVCVPSAVKLKTPPFHHEVYKSLQNPEYKRVLIAAPRGTSKSTMSTLIYPLWLTAFSDPENPEFIVIISEARQQSINFLSRIKYHLDKSDAIRTLFGDLSSRTAVKWTLDDIILANGVRIVAVGTGQRVRGFIDRDSRPTKIIVDDFESEKNAWTREAREKNLKWMTEAVIPSLAQDRPSKIIVIGTVISEDCFLYKAKQNSMELSDHGVWKVHWYQVYDEEGNYLWPEMYGPKKVEEIKNEYLTNTGSLNGFYQEYMNIAQDPEKAPFKPHYIQYHSYNYEWRDGQSLLVRKEVDRETTIPITTYMGVDPASSLRRGADFFVMFVVGVDEDGNFYDVAMYREHEDPATQPDKILDFYLRYHPRRVTIETVGYQETLRANVRAMMRKRGLHIPGLEKGFNPRTPKNERLLSLQAPFANGKVFIRHDNKAFENELLSYPRGSHDDTLDAFWMAIQKAKPVKLGRKIADAVKKRVHRIRYDWMIT